MNLKSKIELIKNESERSEEIVLDREPKIVQEIKFPYHTFDYINMQPEDKLLNLYNSFMQLDVVTQFADILIHLHYYSMALNEIKDEKLKRTGEHTETLMYTALNEEIEELLEKSKKEIKNESER